MKRLFIFLTGLFFIGLTVTIMLLNHSDVPMNRFRSLCFIALAMAFASIALAQIPRSISYQGYIANGNSAISDGQHILSVTIYDAATGGNSLFNETIPTVTSKGIFSIVIGAANGIPSSIDFSSQYFLAVSIDGGSELTPRTPLTSVPYALMAQKAAQANSLSPNATGVVTTINELDGPIRIVGDSTMLVTQNGKVITLSAHGGSGSGGGISGLQSPQKTLDITFPSGPVSSLDIRDSAISTKKIANGAVTAAKLNQSGATTGQVLKWDGTTWAAADDDTGSGSGNAWLTGGNQNTINGVDFIGTTDNQGLDLRANNTVVLRLNTNNSLQRDAGGNARGTKAIDLQITRSAVSQVASGNASAIGGGEYNTASGQNATIGGGVTNIASASYTTVGGGGNNNATDLFATIAGGGHNVASNTYSTVAGGENNAATGNASTVGGGVSDTATAYVATVSGGANNIAQGTGSTIAGGAANTVSDYYTVVSGGSGNTVSGDGSTISGGYFNLVDGGVSTISGGYSNAIVGDASTIAGGAYLRMVGDNNFGFHGATAPSDSVVISGSKIAFFGNVDLWLGNTDNTAHQLRFYEPQNGGVSFPGANTNYTAIKAGSQSANITYTLPAAAASNSGAFLTTTTGGQWGWSNTAVWDGTNSRLGINTSAPLTSTDINGDIAVREHSVSLANGANNNVNIGQFSFIQLVGPNAAFTISGLAGGANGKMVVLYNSSGQPMTITNNDNNSNVSNRIFTGNGNAYTTPAGYSFDVVTLIYSVSKGGWLLVSHN